MPLKFNDTVIENTGHVQYNGNELDKLQLNGVTVWEKGFPGKSATGSVVLPSQSNYMVWAYFNGSDQAHMFYASENYGLNIANIVNNFNTAYSSQGFVASYSGNTLSVVSPQATGGDCNGQYVRIEYRTNFTGAPNGPVYTLTLTGGQNAY